MHVDIDAFSELSEREDKSKLISTQFTARPTFFTGNGKAGLIMLTVFDKDSVVTDQVLLQVNVSGKLSIARRRKDV